MEDRLVDVDVSAMTDDELREHIRNMQKKLETQTTAENIVDKETLKQMLRMEQELRTSDTTQQKYTAAEKSADTDWMEVTAKLQSQVLRKFGVPEADHEKALYLLRTAHTHYPEDEEFKEIPFFHQMQEEFQATCDFVCVYTAEAHAQDEWPISSGRYHDNIPVIIKQPKCIEDRLAVAEAFVERYDFQWPMVVDPIGEPFDSVYCAWPLRFYVVQNGTLTYKAQPKDCSYDIGHLWAFLQQQQQHQQQGDGTAAGGAQ